MTTAIDVQGLVKRFGRTTALDGLDLRVRTGEVHGFLGPNGAGKSTTIRTLLGVSRADDGTATLLGGDPWRDAATLHRRLAYVPGDVSLWPTLSGGEVIDVLGRMHGTLDRDRRAELIERFELDPRKKSRTYSKGNRQKVALVAAFSSDAELLILDEPTSGLDPLMEKAFGDTLAEEKAHGRTVLLSSHILSEVERLCDRVTIIRAGRTIDTGTLGELRHLGRSTVTAVVRNPPDAHALGALDGVHELHIAPAGAGTGTAITAQADPSAVGQLVHQLSALGLDTLTCTPPSLEDLFLTYYESDSAR
ncbi:ABC transporter ATP-binding protein [Flexivirga sp. ID2601S]|uniref:ABC transporter ATP-binding protein n=1 Tax=Flexivirga aerilata TaxID=1656889 RepID=A0A849AD31_9MICO|nr:ABC transporter ATP-binding protein [Flexivirga aerilata]NNG38774.1 ABC transporter ATP-binding protein [Flexivirga aerilata]